MGWILIAHHARADSPAFQEMDVQLNRYASIQTLLKDRDGLLRYRDLVKKYMGYGSEFDPVFEKTIQQMALLVAELPGFAEEAWRLSDPADTPIEIQGSKLKRSGIETNLPVLEKALERELDQYKLRSGHWLKLSEEEFAMQAKALSDAVKDGLTQLSSQYDLKIMSPSSTALKRFTPEEHKKRKAYLDAKKQFFSSREDLRSLGNALKFKIASTEEWGDRYRSPFAEDSTDAVVQLAKLEGSEAENLLKELHVASEVQEAFAYQKDDFADHREKELAHLKDIVKQLNLIRTTRQSTPEELARAYRDKKNLVSNGVSPHSVFTLPIVDNPATKEFKLRAQNSKHLTLRPVRVFHSFFGGHFNRECVGGATCGSLTPRRWALAALKKGKVYFGEKGDTYDGQIRLPAVTHPGGQGYVADIMLKSIASTIEIENPKSRQKIKYPLFDAIIDELSSRGVLIAGDGRSISQNTGLADVYKSSLAVIKAEPIKIAELQLQDRETELAINKLFPEAPHGYNPGGMVYEAMPGDGGNAFILKSRDQRPKFSLDELEQILFRDRLSGKPLENSTAWAAAYDSDVKLKSQRYYQNDKTNRNYQIVQLRHNPKYLEEIESLSAENFAAQKKSLFELANEANVEGLWKLLIARDPDYFMRNPEYTRSLLKNKPSPFLFLEAPQIINLEPSLVSEVILPARPQDLRLIQKFLEVLPADSPERQTIRDYLWTHYTQNLTEQSGYFVNLVDRPEIFKAYPGLSSEYVRFLARQGQIDYILRLQLKAVTPIEDFEKAVTQFIEEKPESVKRIIGLMSFQYDRGQNIFASMPTAFEAYLKRAASLGDVSAFALYLEDPLKAATQEVDIHLVKKYFKKALLEAQQHGGFDALARASAAVAKHPEFEADYERALLAALPRAYKGTEPSGDIRLLEVALAARPNLRHQMALYALSPAAWRFRNAITTTPFLGSSQAILNAVVQPKHENPHRFDLILHNIASLKLDLNKEMDHFVPWLVKSLAFRDSLELNALRNIKNWSLIKKNAELREAFEGLIRTKIMAEGRGDQIFSLLREVPELFTNFPKLWDDVIKRIDKDRDHLSFASYFEKNPQQLTDLIIAGDQETHAFLQRYLFEKDDYAERYRFRKPDFAEEYFNKYLSQSLSGKKAIVHALELGRLTFITNKVAQAEQALTPSVGNAWHLFSPAKRKVVNALSAREARSYLKSVPESQDGICGLFFQFHLKNKFISKAKP